MRYPDEDTQPESQWVLRTGEWRFESTPLPPECPGLVPTGAKASLTCSPSIELDSDFADELLTQIY